MGCGGGYPFSSDADTMEVLLEKKNRVVFFFPRKEHVGK